MTFRQVKFKKIKNQCEILDFLSTSINLFNKTTNKRCIVGAVAGFIDHEEVRYSCVGTKSIDQEELLTIDTTFEIGSITKVFTTLLLMDLVAKNQISLDMPIDLLLPNVKIPKAKNTKITLRHLATHHSGLPNRPCNLDPQNLMNPYADYSIKDLYSCLKKCTLVNPPGKQFSYSNLGVALLGHILSLSTNKTYAQLVTDIILNPLSMPNTFVPSPAKIQGQMCTGHHLGQPVEHWDTPDAIIGAGGLRSNIQDMTKFLKANLGPLTSPVTDLLHQCHQPQKRYQTTEGVGLGWIISYRNNQEVLWHDGFSGGFSSFIGFNKKMQRGIVILSNSREEWLEPFCLAQLSDST